MLHIYTGNGKGKTTAAVGQIVRAVGHKKRVCLIQLFKPEKFYGEQKILKKLRNLKIYSFAPHHPFCSKNDNVANVQTQCARALRCLAKIFKEKYDLVVLDEFNIAFRDDFLDVNQFLEIIKSKPRNTTVIITGRSAPKKLLKTADLITEMREIKHPFLKGIKSKRGIEY